MLQHYGLYTVHLKAPKRNSADASEFLDGVVINMDVIKQRYLVVGL